MSKRGVAWQAEILTIMRRQMGPLSAYDVMDALRQTNPKIAPPTVYRALSALTDQGLVHRLESMNAYVTCQHEGHEEAAILSICDDCGTVEESMSAELQSSLISAMRKTGFAAQRHVIEVHGTCAACGTEQSAR